MSYELPSLSVSGAGPGPRLLITGGVHGDEFEPMAAIRRLAREIPPSRLRGSVVLVPCVNEPAFRLGRRTADDGLDLARTCPGNPSGSVTEQIAAALSQQIRSADYYVDLHTGGTSLQVYPLAGYVLHPDPRVLALQRRMARAMGLPFLWGTDPNLPGRSLSVARDAGVPAIYAEYLGGGMCSAAGVNAYIQGCRQLLVELDMLDGPPPTLSPPLVVEDSRPNSGHMQIHHPAPHDGFFEPAVVLGQRIERGQTLGIVFDVLGQHPTTVTAEQTGVVVVLRTFARVLSQDCLGVIVETAGTLPSISSAPGEP